jgi:hypothetical protein
MVTNRKRGSRGVDDIVWYRTFMWVPMSSWLAPNCKSENDVTELCYIFENVADAERANDLDLPLGVSQPVEI